MTTSPQTNPNPRVSYGPIGDRPATPTEAGLIYISPEGVSGWDGSSWYGAASYPADPHYYVSTTGSDTAAGTLAAPLASVAEALRRLSITRWTGSATVSVEAGTYDLGADPSWIVPAPQSGAMPVLIQGTMADSGLGVITPTGGTQGTTFGGAAPFAALPTITSAAVTATDAYASMFLRFTTGDAEQRPVHTNNNTGTFTLTGKLSQAPTNLMPFRVESVATKFNWSGGAFRLTGPMYLNALDFDGDEGVISAVDATIETSRCLFEDHAGTIGISIRLLNSQWLDGAHIGGGGSLLPLNTALEPCGSHFGSLADHVYFDGSGDTMEPNSGSMSFHGTSFQLSNSFLSPQASVRLGMFDLCGFTTYNWYVEGGANALSLQNFVATGGVKYFNGAVEFYTGACGSIAYGVMSGSAVNVDCLFVQGGTVWVQSVSGANANAGTKNIATARGGSVQLGDACTGWTATGGVSIVQVGGNAGTTTLALAFAGATANSTDVGAASSQLCTVGP